MSLMNLIVLANVVVFIVCVIVQKRSMVKMAFGRVVFIEIAMFFFTGLVYISPSAPRVLVWILFGLTWAFTLFMTMYAISRKNKQEG